MADVSVTFDEVIDQLVEAETKRRDVEAKLRQANRRSEQIALQSQLTDIDRNVSALKGRLRNAIAAATPASPAVSSAVANELGAANPGQEVWKKLGTWAMYAAIAWAIYKYVLKPVWQGRSLLGANDDPREDEDVTREPPEDDSVACRKCGAEISNEEYDDNHGLCDECAGESHEQDRDADEDEDEDENE